MNEEEGHRLTGEILAKAIAKAASAEESGIEVLDFEVSAGSNKGDNFACVMKAVTVKAKVDGEEKEFKFMTKAIPLHPMREKGIREVRYTKC